MHTCSFLSLLSLFHPIPFLFSVQPPIFSNMLSAGFGFKSLQTQSAPFRTLCWALQTHCSEPGRIGTPGEMATVTKICSGLKQNVFTHPKYSKKSSRNPGNTVSLCPQTPPKHSKTLKTKPWRNHQRNPKKHSNTTSF